jgi:NAD(P)-dependent dehydrogenase (short-subunit alcohol dehydrogenase family)
METNPFSLENQVGIVTGGGQGLGKVFCHAFAQAGADIVVVDLNRETGPVTVQEVEARGRQALFLPADVSSYADVQRMVEQTLARFGRIDFLMNNAGICLHKAAAEVTEEEWRSVLDVNLTGLFFCCQAVGRTMIERFQKEQVGGRIINIASMSGLIVNRPQAQTSYNVSKAGVIHLTRSLAVEWARYHIRVNAVAPGYMNTKMAEPFFAKPEYGGIWLDSIPMRRWGEPKELGPLAVFLASEASSYITGATLVADGGYTAL